MPRLHLLRRSDVGQHTLNDDARRQAGVALPSKEGKKSYGCGCDTWKQATSYCATTFGLPELTPPWLVGFA